MAEYDIKDGDHNLEEICPKTRKIQMKNEHEEEIDPLSK